jgi:hypothetical protein
MAFVFNKINSLLNPEDGQQKQDIFSGGQPATGSGEPQTQGMGTAPKTTTEGDVGAPNAGATGVGGEGQPVEAQQQTAAATALKKNKMSTPDFANRAQSEVDKASTALQDEANSYVANAKAQKQDFDTGDLDKAVAGDADASGRARNYLTKAAAPVEQFSAKTDYDIEDIDQMSTDAGVENLLRRDAGAQYSGGESKYDMMLLNRTPEFGLIRSQLRNKQDTLRKTADTLKAEKTKEAQAAIEANLAAGKSAASGYLGTKAEAVRKAAADRAAQENAARAALRAGGAVDTGADSQAAIDALVNDYNAGGNARMADFIRNSGIDARQFVNVAGDVSADDLYSGDEAGQFNNIMSLLGKQDAITAGKGAGSRTGFNLAGYKDAVNKAAMKNYDTTIAEERAAAAAKAAAEKEAAEAAALAAQQKTDADNAAAAKAAEDAVNAAADREAERARNRRGNSNEAMFNEFLGNTPYDTGFGGGTTKELTRNIKDETADNPAEQAMAAMEKLKKKSGRLKIKG